jgi:DNA-directed RNA polymerase specialized sigma24 family protein
LSQIDDSTPRRPERGAAEPRSQVVELRFFGGLSLEETAEALHVSVDTVKRDFRVAKLWLLRELRGERPDDT